MTIRTYALLIVSAAVTVPLSPARIQTRPMRVYATQAQSLETPASDPAVVPVLPLTVSSAQLFPLASLGPGETVFAYGRISSDGRRLAYTSQAIVPRGVPTRTVRVIDIVKGTIEFEEEGVDAYWSPDGSKLIYLSELDPSSPGVAILDWASRRVTRNVAPIALGDYFSWGKRRGRDVIATIKGNYYYLSSDQAVLPAEHLTWCEVLGGTGDRPLLSKDGSRLTVFVKGYLAIRTVDSCDGILMTNMQGAKADFSYDGNLIAFHHPKSQGDGFRIAIVDLTKMTVAELDLPGSSYYPSWTASGALAFHYESDKWNGFVLASHLDGLPKQDLHQAPVAERQDRIRWKDIVEADAQDSVSEWRLVVIWAPWNVHGPEAIKAAELAQTQLRREHLTVTAYESAVPGPHVEQMRRSIGSTLAKVFIRAGAWPDTWANAQIPTVLVFHNDLLATRLLGAPTPLDLSMAIKQCKPDC